MPPPSHLRDVNSEQQTTTNAPSRILSNSFVWVSLNLAVSSLRHTGRHAILHAAAPDHERGVVLSGGVGFIAPLHNGAQPMPEELPSQVALDPAFEFENIVSPSLFVSGFRGGSFIDHIFARFKTCALLCIGCLALLWCWAA